MHVLLSGYYGFGNTGDEALLKGILTAIRPFGGLKVTVLSADPESTRALHGVEALPRDRMGVVWRAMKESDLFISGGGGLLQDRTSPRSSFYYLGLIEMAKRAKTPVYLYGQGIGPIERPAIQYAVKRVLSGVHGIGVRDEASKELLLTWGVPEEGIEVTADPAFVLERPSDEEVAEAVEKVDAGGQGPRIGVVWRSCAPAVSAESQRLLTVYAAKALALVARELSASLLLFPFHPAMDRSEVRLLAQALRREGADLPVVVVGGLPFDEQFALLAATDLLLTVRYHGLALGAIAGVPSVALAYDPKVAQLAHAAGLKALSPHEISPELLRSALMDVWENRDEIRWTMDLFVTRSRRAALQEGERATRFTRGFVA